MSRPKRENVSSASLQLMGIPSYLCDVNLDNFETGGSSDLKRVKLFIGDFIDNLEEHVNSGDGIFFCGNNGVGKTMLSCIIMKEAYKLRYMCRRISLLKYIDLYTNSWGSESNFEDVDKYEWFKSCDFLVLEEVGKEINSKVAIPILEDLLRYRQESNKSTIICTNLSPETFKENYGNSITSLVNGGMQIVKIISKDKRLEGNK